MACGILAQYIYHITALSEQINQVCYRNTTI